MDNKQIDSFLSSNKYTKKIYVGCRPCDKLPTWKIPDFLLPIGMVINLCDSTRRDDFCHWTAVYVDKEKIEYFDSSGDDSASSNVYIKSFIDRQEKTFSFNTKQIQDITSDRCGLFVMTYLYAKATKYSLNYFLKLFNVNSNLKKNDKIVDSLVKNIFSKKNKKMLTLLNYIRARKHF